MKTSIAEKNLLLSQSIAYLQKVHVQSQRLQGGVVAGGNAKDSAGTGSSVGAGPMIRVREPGSKFFLAI